jgi:hypothetical protein
LECASAVRQRDAAQLFSQENLLINARNISRSKEVNLFYDFLETRARIFLMITIRCTSDADVRRWQA